MNYITRSFSRVHYKDLWSSYDICKHIVKAEWARYYERCGENPMLRFKQMAKWSLVELHLWTKEEFKGRKNKVDKAITD